MECVRLLVILHITFSPLCLVSTSRYDYLFFENFELSKDLFIKEQNLVRELTISRQNLYNNIKALTSGIDNISQHHPDSHPSDISGNEKWLNLGKELYFKKIGQMGLSRNQCHDDRVGNNLRAEKVSQGHINGFPTYLLRWSKIASVHRRIQFCNEQARAIPFKIFSKEYNALQLYLTWRGKGLEIETPAVRK